MMGVCLVADTEEQQHLNVLLFPPPGRRRFSSFLSLLLLNILYVRAFAGGIAISLSIYARLLLFATTLFAVTVVVVVVVRGVVVVVGGVVVVHLCSLFSESLLLL